MDTDGRVYDDTDSRVYADTDSRVYDDTDSRVYDDTDGRMYDDTDGRPYLRFYDYQSFGTYYLALRVGKTIKVGTLPEVINVNTEVLGTRKAV